VQPEPIPEIVPRRGLALLVDILIAPRRAYATIALTGEWWPAAVVVLVCVVASDLLPLPAIVHVGAVTGHKPLPLSGRTIAIAASYAAVAFLWQLFSWNVVASLYANFCVAGRPAFALMHRLFFALAANATVPAALGALAGAIAIRLHDPNSYQSASQLVNALPISLAVFANPKNVSEVSFLSNFDVTTVWSVLLVAFGGRAIGGIKLVPALIVPLAVVLLWAVLMIFQTQ
jgi:hypothetical protein